MQVGEEMLCDRGSIKRIEEETELAIPDNSRKGYIRTVKYVYC